MDAHRFDALIQRFFSTSTSRRGGLRFVPAAVGLALGLSSAESDARKHRKKKKKKNQKQQDNQNDQNNQDLPNTVGECKGDADCDRLYAPGLNCIATQCVCKVGGNCTGCCKDSKKCILAENQNFDSCGLGGNACESCNPYVACNRQQGKCVCSPTDSCPGCCWDNNKRCSVSGTENTTCGKHIICVDCTATGQICQSNGTCCVAVGGTCNDTTRKCCAGANISCQDGECKQL